jgi:hypothetical protein
MTVLIDRKQFKSNQKLGYESNASDSGRKERPGAAPFLLIPRITDNFSEEAREMDVIGYSTAVADKTSTRIGPMG